MKPWGNWTGIEGRWCVEVAEESICIALDVPASGGKFGKYEGAAEVVDEDHEAGLRLSCGGSIDLRLRGGAS